METTNAKQQRISFVGFAAFMIVLFTMPLGHAAMIIMEKTLGETYLTPAAFVLGLLGAALAIWGFYIKNENGATFAGLIGGLMTWTGWIEFTFVYFARRYNVAPAMENGEIVTKPEYLVMMSSVGFLAVIFMFYIFSARTRCVFFSWIQKVLRINRHEESLHTVHSNHSLTTFVETNILLWACYLVLMFAYDDQILGDRHPVTAFIAFGSLVWSAYLFVKLMKIRKIGYAIRYAIPTVIIFWNFVEILGRWDFFHEIWTEPGQYKTEIIIMFVVFLLFSAGLFFRKKHVTK